MKFARLKLVSVARPCEAACNMATDEAILLTSKTATLRCYRWSRPAVTFGYFVKWESVNKAYPARDLVRRWTGGGIVEHGEDFTYALVLPATVRPLGTIELYRDVHRAIAAALREAGREVEIATGPAQPHSRPLQTCFEQPVEFDLKVDGKKIAGAAIRRHRRGILLQGSIQRVTIPVRFETMLACALGEQIDVRPISPEGLNLAAQLTAEKYGSEAWNRRF
jgi:lipoyl(octanoyl) transferase